ncbi:MAG: methylmalonyl Co-A mutase-associated GTPase MeaB, partial [Pseudomonadota bacterium]|nr:methylmalonyl Co-A mutase-associated GTPase MeaB [Pseudomonadota bacterium]
FRAAMTDSGEFFDKRSGQAKAWMWSEIEENLVATLRDHPEIKARMAGLEADVAAGTVAPGAAAREMLSIFLGT